jgi:hypothetical protein
MTYPVLEGKVAIVTGAAMGMGAATAILFAEAARRPSQPLRPLADPRSL